MNKVALLLTDLHDAETDLAAEYRAVSERHTTDHDVHYLCNTLAAQCEQHAKTIEDSAAKLQINLSGSRGSHPLSNIMAGLRHKAAELLGRQPETALLLLRDLRQLYLMAEEANLHWIAVGQVAQAIRDQALLDTATGLHQQTLTQIKWLKTRLKEAVPQAMTVE